MPKFYYVKSSNCPKSLRLSFLLLLFPLFSFGQTLTGLWTGALHNDSSTVRKDQLFEIALTEYNGKVYGYSRSEFIVNDTLYYIVKRVKGTIEGDVCEVSDDEIVSYNFRGRLDKGIRVTSTFRRSQSDSTWYLDGTWKTNATKKYYSVTGKVTLSEEKDLAMSKLFPHLEELNMANDVAFYKDRLTVPAVVRVVKPVTSVTLVQPLNDMPGEMQGIAVRPANTSQAEMKQPEETILDPVQKTGDALVKTKTKNIPANDNNTVIHQPGITTVQAEMKQPEATILAPVQKTGETLAKTETKNIPANNGNPVAHQPNITTTSAENDVVAARVNKSQASSPPQANAEQNAISRTTKPGKGQPVLSASNTSNSNPAPGNTVNKTSPDVAVNKPASSSAGNAGAAKTATGQTSTPASPKIASVSATTNQPEAVKTTPLAAPAAINNSLAKAQPGTTGSVQPAESVKTSVTDITAKASVIAGRKSEFNQLVNFKSDSLVISLYDNGEIDGDTVSVFMNGEPLLLKQGLKSSAIKKTIYITPGQEQDFTLVMFAESLGKYPPNTGLLVIRDGEDVYNLRFSSDFEKNAGIVFRRKK